MGFLGMGKGGKAFRDATKVARARAKVGRAENAYTNPTFRGDEIAVGPTQLDYNPTLQELRNRIRSKLRNL